MRRSKVAITGAGRSGDLFEAAPAGAVAENDAAQSNAVQNAPTWKRIAPKDLAQEAVGEKAVDEKVDAPKDHTGKDIEAAAVRLLSRREHSIQELRRKLAAKGYPDSGIAAVLDKLAAKKLVSDERFASSYVHHHARRGQGPVRIRAELRQQGITDSQIEQEVSAGDTDWNQLAGEVRRRKFGAELPRTASERAKQARFLQYRGFNSDQIRAALKFDPEMEPE